MPLTTPPPDTVAVGVALLLQVPPVTASLNIVDDPKHILATPVIPAGAAVTVTVLTVVQPVPDSL